MSNEHTAKTLGSYVFAGCTGQNVNFGHAQASVRLRRHTKVVKHSESLKIDNLSELTDLVESKLQKS